VIEWLRETAKPPPGIVVHTNGSLFTGLALLARNKVVVLLAVGERVSATVEQSPRRDERPQMPEPLRYRSASSLWEHEHGQRLDEDDAWRR
jgi:hypothetical protein